MPVFSYWEVWCLGFSMSPPGYPSKAKLHPHPGPLSCSGAPGRGKHLEEPHSFPYWLCKRGSDTSLPAKRLAEDWLVPCEPGPACSRHQWLLIESLPVVTRVCVRARNLSAAILARAPSAKVGF